MSRQFARLESSRDFFLFHSRDEFAIAQQRARGVAQDTAQSKMIIDVCLMSAAGLLSVFCSILAQASRRPTVRLNTGCSAVESLSTQKYPSRSN
jgi:hypothetical protein